MALKQIARNKDSVLRAMRYAITVTSTKISIANPPNGGTPLKVLSNNPARLTVSFQFVGGSGTTWLNNRQSFAASQGIQINITQLPYVIDFEQFPGWAALDWYALGNSVGQSLCIVEQLVNDDR